MNKIQSNCALFVQLLLVLIPLSAFSQIDPPKATVTWFDGSTFKQRESDIVKYTLTDSFFLRSRYNIQLKSDSIIFQGKKYLNTSKFNHYLNFDRFDSSTKTSQRISSFPLNDTLKLNRVTFSKNGSYCLVAQYDSYAARPDKNQGKIIFYVFAKGQLISTINAIYKGRSLSDYSINNIGTVLLITSNFQEIELQTPISKTKTSGAYSELILIHANGQIIRQEKFKTDTTYKLSTIYNTRGTGYMLEFLKDRNTLPKAQYKHSLDEYETFNYKLIYIDQSGEVRWNKNFLIKGMGHFSDDVVEINHDLIFRISLQSTFQEPKIICDQKEIHYPYSKNSPFLIQTILLHTDSTGKLVWYGQLQTDSLFTAPSRMAGNMNSTTIDVLSIQWPDTVNGKNLLDCINLTRLILTRIDLTTHQLSTFVIMENSRFISVVDFQILTENKFLITARFKEPPGGQSIITKDKMQPGYSAQLTGVFTPDQKK
ncbi:MAG: hypothetical protein IM638_14575 [Bacteroidetes bacterium]|nr:hypothetical protein [Bacteroidota bacterium]